MAYSNLLASVGPGQVASFRDDAGVRLVPSRAVAVSHLIASPGWTPVPPLQAALAAALDGGEMLRGSLWHPLRVPVYHPPGLVGGLADRVDEAWSTTIVIGPDPVPIDDWFRVEIEKVISIFRHAAGVGEGVASLLMPPTDRRRADRVLIPIVDRP